MTTGPYTMTTTLTDGFASSLERVRGALQEVGFGVITEIDMQATLQAKIGAETPPLVILGACQPALAHRALTADPGVATLLPCNVVVRAAGPGQTIVETLDPMVMIDLAGQSLHDVATDARERLSRVISILEVGA